MGFPETRKSRTTFESCGDDKDAAAEKFAEALSEAGFDADIGDDGAVEHDCDDAKIFAPLAQKAEAPFLKKAEKAKPDK